MRENRTYGSEGGETGNSTGLPYPYLYQGVVATSPRPRAEPVALQPSVCAARNGHAGGQTTAACRQRGP